MARFTNMIDWPQSSDSDMLTLNKLDAQKLARFTNMIDWPQSSDSMHRNWLDSLT